MANTDALNIARQVVGLGGTTPTTPTTKTPVLSDSDITFGNWTNSKDTKVAAKDLFDRGLVNGDQLVNENQDTSSSDAIKNKNQSDWKIAAAQRILQKAYDKNIRTPTAFLQPENRAYLLSGVDPRVKDAINDPTFNQIHPNWWQVLGNSILPQQWAKYDAMNKQNLVTK